MTLCRWLGALVIVAALSSMHRPVAAGPIVVYSTLSPTGTYNAGATTNIQGTNNPSLQNYAAPFTPAVTVPLDTVELGLTSLSAVDIVEVVLMSSSGAIPDAVIESFGTFSGFPQFGTTDNFLVTATSSLQPQLTAGTEYWVAVLAANADTKAGWNHSFLDGPVAIDHGSGWVSQANNDLPPLRVTGIPEPSALTLAGLGLLGLAAYGWRRRKRS